MSTLSELLAQYTDLDGGAVDHLQRVVGEWQLLADLSFGDQLLWVRRSGAGEVAGPASTMICASQSRPTTAATVFQRDEVGARPSAAQAPLLQRAWDEGAVVRGIVAVPGVTDAARMAAVPVRYAGRTVGVVAAVTAGVRPRVPSPLEAVYDDSAALLQQMMAEGAYPPDEADSASHSSPRAGDGLIRLDSSGHVAYASPNAQSAFHRMGLTVELVGRDLVQVTEELVWDPLDGREAGERLRDTLVHGTVLRIELDTRGATILMRALPLRTSAAAAGALVLVRDVTEVKRRDRALLSKDATIREIHHRVKNNLQTVAALLRLQGRRSGDPEVTAALAEAVRRVSSIALVHETLSISVGEDVDLDAVVDRLVPIMAEVAGGGRVRIRRRGGLGSLGADRATPLVMVMVELVQNAIEHGYEGVAEAGDVTIDAVRSARTLEVTVHDDGRGVPDGFTVEDSPRLGLQIVRTLVGADLGGEFSLGSAEGGGTDAIVRMPAVRSRE
ncbi:sensor histidine kinase [Tomitella fengzijianii]|uniref:histidine kinase n=1 Tax=Tomitella fengzijianii TaxID=2597660 RepID=A0A516X539_9ACTN|nr:histidine kinase N-terminal domain-containing protein [Tomitella fengzijianii]QDQ98186.1 ATPase [Tomitella fengzijianii]